MKNVQNIYITVLTFTNENSYVLPVSLKQRFTFRQAFLLTYYMTQGGRYIKYMSAYSLHAYLIFLNKINMKSNKMPSIVSLIDTENLKFIKLVLQRMRVDKTRFRIRRL